MNVESGKKMDILQYAIENDILDINTILKSVNDMKKMEILKEYSSEIWLASDGRFKAYIPDATKKEGRRLIARKTREELENQLIKEFELNKESKKTVEVLFYEWLEYALNSGDLVKGTVDRYQNDYDKFIKGSDFSQINICNVSQIEVVRFLKAVVCGRGDEKITKKCFVNIKTLIVGIFVYAKTEKELLCIPIKQTLQDIKISDKQFKKSVIKDSEQVFSDSEVVLLSEYIMENYKSTRELGILLTLITGVRVGELSALKVTDREQNRLYIQRTEIKEKDESGRTIVKVREFPKSEESINGIELSDSACIILDLIESYNKRNNINSKFLFYDNKYGRIKTRSFDKKIRRICKSIGIPVRSMHKLRKTYASILFSNGIEDKIVQSQMRHKDINTTHKHYEFSVRSRLYKREQLNSVSILALNEK